MPIKYCCTLFISKVHMQSKIAFKVTKSKLNTLTVTALNKACYLQRNNSKINTSFLNQVILKTLFVSLKIILMSKYKLLILESFICSEVKRSIFLIVLLFYSSNLQYYNKWYYTRLLFFIIYLCMKFTISWSFHLKPLFYIKWKFELERCN